MPFVSLDSLRLFEAKKKNVRKRENRKRGQKKRTQDGEKGNELTNMERRKRMKRMCEATFSAMQYEKFQTDQIEEDNSKKSETEVKHEKVEI